MPRIFVSYSRKNKDFCRQLTNELQKRDIDFWVDWSDIPPTVDWKKEIQKSVEEADTFIAVVSPEWITSENCLYELEVAEKNGKRLIPVVPCDIVWDSVPRALAQLNFIFFTEDYDFKQQINNLITALDTDYDWLKTHRRLQVKALEWERASKENGFLLRSKDLEDAEQQISVNANKDPHPTDLQREYVLASRQAATRQRRVTMGVMVFIILMLSGISAYLGIPRILDRMAQVRARGEMVQIPAGPAIYGTENEAYVKENSFPPRQTIDLLPAFQIGKYEVTNYQYGQCVTYGPCTVPVDQTEFQDDAKQNHPVVNITLFQANTYCQWLGQRLPNQYEWERAARGPKGDNWPWGNDEPAPEKANMPWADYHPEQLQSVDSYSAGKSPEGVYNLIGNAWEWTSSYAALTYTASNLWDGNPDTYNGLRSYVQRGGGWRFPLEEIALFNVDHGTSAYDDLGFRCAADVK